MRRLSHSRFDGGGLLDTAYGHPKHHTRWAPVESIAKKLGWSPPTLDKWLEQAERDAGTRAGLTRY